MSGVEIIGGLLRADTSPPPSVAADRIKAGVLPDNVLLTAILVKSVSLVDRQPLKRMGWYRATERVSVTVRAGSYRDQVAAIKWVRAVCAGRTGTIGGAQNVAILTAGTGPEVTGPANSFERTQDFRVGYDAEF